MRSVLIIGAGPAGLTAAYELLRRGEYTVTVLEESDIVGGLSRTVNYKGNRMDIGGHRFFTKVPEVNAWWEDMLPLQGALPLDDRLLGRSAPLRAGGPDPEKTDRVMLVLKHISGIWFRRNFFDYSISMKAETLRDLDFGTAVAAGFSYLASALRKREERSLEDFYINRFGGKLYSLFFESCTAKRWGRRAAAISPDWGARRVRGLSIRALLEDVLAKSLHRRNRKVETSRIGEFHDPKLGPGRLREITADEIERMGGRSLKNARVTGLRRENDRIRSLICERDGRRERMEADVFISSMPVRDLVPGMDCTPNEIRDIAAGLPYRDYITVGVLTKGLLLQNRTGIPTLGGIVPDNRICVNDSSVHVGRFQIYNNIDHSMCTAFEAVRAILSGSADKRAIWSVNTEEACHESEKHRA